MDAFVRFVYFRSFYSDPEQSYLRMNMNNIRLNRNCIAPYKGLWHRAKIVSIDELHRYRVKVSFWTDRWIRQHVHCFS